MMKRILLVMVMVLLVSTAVSAQLPPQGYFGLFFDAGRATWCYTGVGMIPVYFFALPSVDGLKCVELMTPVPDVTWFLFGEAFDPGVKMPVIGTLATGLVACFTDCQYDWVQVCSANLMIPNMDPAEIPIVEYAGSPWPKILDCLDPANEVEAIVWTHLYTNYAECPPYASRESTWGAIKNMYE